MDLTDIDSLLYLSMLNNPDNNKMFINHNQDLYKQMVDYVKLNQGRSLGVIKNKLVEYNTQRKAYVKKLTDFEDSFSRKIGKEVTKALAKEARGQKPKDDGKEPAEVNQGNPEGDKGEEPEVIKVL